MATIGLNQVMLVALALAAGLQGAAADPLRYRRAVVGSKDTVIGIGARWNKSCDSIGLPVVTLDSAPEHGFVCVRTGMVKPRSIIFGNASQCLDTPIRGVQIVYRSVAGFSGSDVLGYTLTFPRGARSYAVELAVAPAAGPSQSGPSLSERQPIGAIPECAALVS